MSDKERNELRLLAHDIIMKLYDANAAAAIELLRAHIERCSEALAAPTAKPKARK